jgi:hypothetical protein
MGVRYEAAGGRAPVFSSEEGEMTKLAISVATVVAVAMTGLLSTSAIGGEGEGSFRAGLDGWSENPSISTVARGRFTAKVNEASQTITYKLTYSGIEGGTATQAHIHLGRARTNGGVAAFLCGGGDKPACPPTAGTVRGVIDPADVVGPAEQGIEPGSFRELVRAMRAHATYANVHSSPRWPGGEIRGEILGGDDD